ncbi:unnamed protein product [Calypogeia fissa]
MGQFKRGDHLRTGFRAEPMKPIPKGRKYQMFLILATIVLVGVWIHESSVDCDKHWFSGFRSDYFAKLERRYSWVKYLTTSNETLELLAQWRHHVQDSTCIQVETKTIRILGLPSTTPGNPVRLQSGVIHKIFIVSLDENEEQVCEGGDYYETDLSGERWKSRPPVTDLQNGSYEVLLQVDEGFTGLYEFKVILLYSRFHGLELVEGPSYYFHGGEVLATLELLFEVPQDNAPHEGSSLPQPSLCKDGDYNLTRWSGRWTRSAKNESCVVDTEGRYQCLPPNTPCELPWCEGPLDRVDSNGWVYSAHCRFKLFTADEAWSCLDKKWLFSWGDSTSQHTWQNLLAFVMDYDSINATDVPRRMDREWIRPETHDGKKPEGMRQSFRLTMIYNGAAQEEGQFQGLESLHVDYFRKFLRGFFVKVNETTYKPPDILVMNSGLHDAFYYENPEQFVQKGVSTGVHFWKEILDAIRPHIPQIIYRTSVATAGTARSKQYNPQKIEHYNRLFVEGLMKISPPNFRIVDGFDLTFPWHYDNTYSDGTHYGLKPNLGVPGHHYFVDHMFAHMLLNSICLK